MPYAGANDALYYEDVGEGPSILFIPGFGGVGSFWRNQIDFFSQRFRVISVDQRGAGASARSRQVYSIGQMADDIRTVMDAARMDSVALVGHSTGGAIAQTLAVSAPERIAGLVLSSTWCKPGNYFRRIFEFRKSLLQIGATDLFHKAGVFFRYPPVYAEAHDSTFESGGAVDLDITIARIDAILQADMSAVSPRVEVPTLVLAASDDALIPKYMSDELAERIPDARYVILDSGGHFIPETRCNDYNALVDEFLGSLGRGLQPRVTERRLAQ